MARRNLNDRRAKGPPLPDIQSELIELSVRGSLPTAVLGLVGQSGGTFLVAYVFSDRFSLTLASLMALLGIVRTVWVASMVRSPAARDGYRTSPWRRRAFTTLMLIYYNTLSVSTAWNYHCHRTGAEQVCAISILFVCLAINGRISLNVPAAKVYGLSMLLTLLVCMYNPHDPMMLLADLLIFMFSVAHCHAIQDKFDIVAEQIQNQRQLRLLSERDALTGLMNRRAFASELKRLSMSDTTFAVLYVDLDRFKPVNDLHGHAVGDELLRQVGKRLVGNVRAQDIVARLGGDEFAVLQLPVTDMSSAKALGQRITEAIARPFDLGDASVTVGASIGIALPVPGETDPAPILKRADDALYQAKQAGRGRFVCAV